MSGFSFSLKKLNKKFKREELQTVILLNIN